jgi:hypothetical protein
MREHSSSRGLRPAKGETSGMPVRLTPLRRYPSRPLASLPIVAPEALSGVIPERWPRPVTCSSSALVSISMEASPPRRLPPPRRSTSPRRCRRPSRGALRGQRRARRVATAAVHAEGRTARTSATRSGCIPEHWPSRATPSCCPRLLPIIYRYAGRSEAPSRTP